MSLGKKPVLFSITFSEKILIYLLQAAPSGLKYANLSVYKKHKANKELYSIHIKDLHENVLNRLTFYDKDSNPIVVKMNKAIKGRYLQRIREDYEFFRQSYARADFTIDINGIKLKDIPNFIINELNKNIVKLNEEKNKR